MALKDIAEALVAHCRNGTEREALATLYADDAVSSEAMSFDGRSPDTAGRDGISGKHDWWDANFETHSSEVIGPFLHQDTAFTVMFKIDCTEKASGQRMPMTEIARYVVEGDKIVREEFYMMPMEG
ncbi:MAG: nuclear transport factor 2 family protein [Pseudomonadota bacterium]